MSAPLVLELANTLASDRPGRDLLCTRDQLGVWLDAHAPIPRPPVDDDLLAAVRGLRAAIRGLLHAVVSASPPAEADVAAINAAAAGGPAVDQVTVVNGSPRVSPTRSADPRPALLAVLAESAIEIVGGEDRARLRACAGDGCRQFFVAHHPARRWCDSRVCGNRARVARHRAAQSSR